MGFSGLLKTVEHAFSILFYLLLDYHPHAIFLESIRVPLLYNWDVKAIIYIYDCIAAFRTDEIAKSAAHLIRSDLISVEYVINEDKKDFIPKTN